jgi:hypothetical protein
LANSWNLAAGKNKNSSLMQGTTYSVAAQNPNKNDNIK